MFGRSKPNPAANTTPTPSPLSSRKISPSVISCDMNILGNVVSDGFLDINGRIEGNVKCDSTTIREQGKVKGDVVADTIHIYGEVEGLVKAKSVHLYASARVTGVIMHESLSIEDGAFVDGKFKRTDKVFIEDDIATLPAMPFGFGSNEDELMDTPRNGDHVMDNLRLISG